MLQRSSRLLATLTALAMLATYASAATVVVYSNNPAPGDDFTNASTTFANQLIGSSGWLYNNVRNNGHVGIRTDLPRSGNGSVWFKGEQGPTGDSSKADVEYWATQPPLGTLGNLTSLKYEWYRKSGSYTAAAHLHPVLRLYISSPDGSKKGYIVYEGIYNLQSTPTDTWVTVDILANNYRMWSTGTLPYAFAEYYDVNKVGINAWKANYGNYYVLAISAGIGSGWGTFEGAVDNITVGFGGLETTTNFEVVPEPASMALFGLGLAAVGGLIRRQRD